MSVTVKVTIDSKLPAPDKAKKLADLWLANSVLKDTAPYVPADEDMTLTNTAKVVDGKYVEYPQIYARYVWEGKRMINAKTGRGAEIRCRHSYS